MFEIFGRIKKYLVNEMKQYYRRMHTSHWINRQKRATLRTGRCEHTKDISNKINDKSRDHRMEPSAFTVKKMLGPGKSVVSTVSFTRISKEGVTRRQCYTQ